MDTELAAARAAADQQAALVESTIDEALLPHARALLANNGRIDAWALLATSIQGQIADKPSFMADMIAALAFRIVES